MAAVKPARPAYVLDTVGLVRYVQDGLPTDADSAVRRAEAGEATLLVPAIVLGEFLYSLLRGRLVAGDVHAIAVEQLARLEAAPYTQLVDMTMGAWRHFLALQVSELHDRMICAIALSRQVPVITNDPEIAAAGIHTIW